MVSTPRAAGWLPRERTPRVRGLRAPRPELRVDGAQVVHQLLRGDVGEQSETADALDFLRARVPRVDHAETALARRVED